MSAGRVLRAAREAQKLSLRELGERAGLSATYLSRVENGLMPSPSACAIVALALGLNADEILWRAGHLPPDASRRIRACRHCYVDFVSWLDSVHATHDTD